MAASSYGTAAEPADNVLALEDIEAGYGKKQILHRLSMHVAPGEILAIVGANGAGKSTALKTLAGELFPWRGRVILEGRDVTREPLFRRARAGVGYLMQRSAVFPSMSVHEHLVLAAGRVPKSSRAEVIEDAVEQFPALMDLLPRRAGLLSGGQRETLALATVLAARPRWLLLDEPTAGLAPGLAAELLERLRTLASDRAIGVVVVEQRVVEILKVADRALAMAGGATALETGRPAAWLDGDELDSVFFGDSLESWKEEIQ